MDGRFGQVTLSFKMPPPLEQIRIEASRVAESLHVKNVLCCNARFSQLTVEKHVTENICHVCWVQIAECQDMLFFYFIFLI